MKLIFSSAIPSITVAKELYAPFFLEKKNSKVALIMTACTEYKADNWNAVQLKETFDKIGRQSTFIDIEFDNPNQLLDYDLIIFLGGNPFYLLHHIRKSGTDILLQRLNEKKVIVHGISAGALIFCPDLQLIEWLTPEQNDIPVNDLAGLNFSPKYIVPHYDKYINQGRIDEDLIVKFEQENQTNV